MWFSSALSGSRARRSAVTLASLALIGSLSACSGDSDEPDPDSSADPSASAADGAAEDGSDAPVGAQVSKCQAQVEVTGAVEADWSGKATVRTPDAGSSNGPAAVYDAKQGKNMLSVYSDGEDFTRSVTLTIGNRTFATTPETNESLDGISDDASGAEVDAELADVEQETVQVVATYTCGKPGKKSRG